ncbi:hypothetical protein BGE01nite_04770 [Brevifollis gellanilyticus]|uniref:Uncharacterized protein n=1 Tax=Brevifollis gellanilyticus TaxID=748831 RepID=A0A512M369_9BACT|nr:hypothetical protein BGE01nite_04770 [Brevifollis gellanilyticus]
MAEELAAGLLEVEVEEGGHAGKSNVDWVPDFAGFHDWEFGVLRAEFGVRHSASRNERCL